MLDGMSNVISPETIQVLCGGTLPRRQILRTAQLLPKLAGICVGCGLVDEVSRSRRDDRIGDRIGDPATEGGVAADQSVRARGQQVTIWLVVVQDKELAGEPDVGMAVVCGDAELASGVGRDMEDELRIAGRCRCVHHVRVIEPGKHYRVDALIRRRVIP